MSRRLPAGNRAVGHDERDEPGHVLGDGALDGPADGVVVEPAAADPLLVHLGEHGAHHPDGLLPAREHLYDAAAALELAVGALLYILGAQADVVLAGEVQVAQGVGLGLLEHLGGLGADPPDLIGDELGARVRARRLQNQARRSGTRGRRVQGARPRHQRGGCCDREIRGSDLGRMWALLQVRAEGCEVMGEDVKWALGIAVTALVLVAFLPLVPVVLVPGPWKTRGRVRDRTPPLEGPSGPSVFCPGELRCFYRDTRRWEAHHWYDGQKEEIMNTTASYTAMGIAKYVVDKCYKDNKPVSNLQLQKMLYFLQLTFIKGYDSPLFDDTFEAWQYGPVIRDVYVKFSEFGGSPIKMIFPDAVRFENDEQEDFINTIIEKLRGLSPWNLVRVSHAKGSPWDEVYNRRGQDKGIIPNGLIVAAAKADQNG